MEGESSRERESLRSPAEVEALVGSAEDLVPRVARHLVSNGIQADYEELLGYGRQGLVEAAHRFDEEQGLDFRRFAYFRVRGAMLDGIRKMGNWSRRAYERISLMRAATEAGEGRDPEDPAHLTGADAARRLNQHMASVTTAMTLGVFAGAAREGEDDIVALDASASSEELLADEQMARLVRQAVTNLPPPEDEVIRRFYVEGERMDEIAADFGRSRSWVSRVHTKALARLGARLRGPYG